MRRYDDPVEVRRGAGPGGDEPEQFLWRGRLWKVRVVVARWVETGAWWQSGAADAVLGAAEPVVGGPPSADGRHDLLAERELWRVQAGRPSTGPGAAEGVFDLSFDWNDGCWQLVGCQD